MGFHSEPQAPDPIIEEKADGAEIWRFRDGRVYLFEEGKGVTKLEFNPILKPGDETWNNRHCFQYSDFAISPDSYGLPDSFGDVPTFDCFDKETRLKISTAIDNCYGELDEAIAEPVRRTRCEAYKTLRGIKWQKKNLKTILKL